jgi:dolichyl-phosphate-mannose--protein O-mannosyl transferase
MSTWKWVNLIASGLILLLTLVTLFQFGRLIWQKKTEENIARFHHLAIRLGVLVGLCILLQIVNYYVRYRFFLSGL